MPHQGGRGQDPGRLVTGRFAAMSRLGEARNPKHEIRNKLQARNSKDQNAWIGPFWSFVFWSLDLFRISDFVLRISWTARPPPEGAVFKLTRYRAVCGGGLGTVPIFAARIAARAIDDAAAKMGLSPSAATEGDSPIFVGRKLGQSPDSPV